jgi:hypothetical protein
MVAAAVKKHVPFILLYGDQPVCTLIVQLKAEHPDVLNLIDSFLGSFHAQCSFISAMNKIFHGSGLSDILVATNAIAE